ncbi:hypothetical protein DACRYDRAFT_15562 [Dacryopinax primogenitus]|uniref:Uncharacterized protein n=1 Tax=Dacryopinax primogenitus (strain DJM 731) TaxID=1858805 RepID=M5FWC4_DACPD|nr:uncharacterized protein DACRYDRAFT_15562 [Dacryopinax primogenitus]EJU02196.1 hypothetical protein DACRYDRAFT_15562 [Dacryopinax primogenitus]
MAIEPMDTADEQSIRFQQIMNQSPEANELSDRAYLFYLMDCAFGPPTNFFDSLQSLVLPTGALPVLSSPSEGAPASPTSSSSLPSPRTLVQLIQAGAWDDSSSCLAPAISATNSHTPALLNDIPGNSTIERSLAPSSNPPGSLLPASSHHPGRLSTSICPRGDLGASTRPACLTRPGETVWAHQGQQDFDEIAQYLAQQFLDVSSTLSCSGDNVPAASGPWWFKIQTKLYLQICEALDMPSLQANDEHVVQDHGGTWSGRLTCEHVAAWFTSFPQAKPLTQSTFTNHQGVLKQWEHLWADKEHYYNAHKEVLSSISPDEENPQLYGAIKLLGVLGFLAASDEAERQALLSIGGYGPKWKKRSENTFQTTPLDKEDNCALPSHLKVLRFSSDPRLHAENRHGLISFSQGDDFINVEAMDHIVIHVKVPQPCEMGAKLNLKSINDLIELSWAFADIFFDNEWQVG